MVLGSSPEQLLCIQQLSKPRLLWFGVSIISAGEGQALVDSTHSTHFLGCVSAQLCKSYIPSEPRGQIYSCSHTYLTAHLLGWVVFCVPRTGETWILMCTNCTLICCCLANSCPTLRSFWLQPARLLCLWDFPGKNTGVDCHFFPQGIVLTQGSILCLLHVLHWQEDSLTLSHQESPLIIPTKLKCRAAWIKSEKTTIIYVLVLIHPVIYLFIQQLLIKHLLDVKHFSMNWSIAVSKTKSPTLRAYILMERDIQIGI